jgi:hypothetical protein
MSAATSKAALKGTGREGWPVTAATFKAGLRVRRSNGGARPEADSAAHVLDP